MNPELQGKMRDYLLGRVTDAQRQEIETKILTDDEAFEELEIAESELVDDYVRGNLAAGDCSEVEQKFLNHEDAKQELRFSRALHRYARPIATLSTEKATSGELWWKQPWMLRTAGAFAIVIVVFGSIWFVRSRRNQPSTFVTLTLALSPSNRSEGGTVTSLRLPLNADALRLNLKLPEQIGSRYRVTFVRPSGEEELPIAEQDNQSVIVIIPSPQLTRGAFALHLHRLKPDGSQERIQGSYFFNVE